MKRGPKIKQFCKRGHNICIVGRDTCGRCKECQRISRKIRYKEDLVFRKKVNKRVTERQQKMRMEKIAIANEARSKPCMDCGNKYPSYVMDFDHRDNTKKTSDISSILGGYGTKVSIQRLKDEIAKCDVVCANCHRIRTHKKQQYVSQERRLKYEKTRFSTM